LTEYFSYTSTDGTRSVVLCYNCNRIQKHSPSESVYSLATKLWPLTMVEEGECSIAHKWAFDR